MIACSYDHPLPPIPIVLSLSTNLHVAFLTEELVHCVPADEPLVVESLENILRYSMEEKNK